MARYIDADKFIKWIEKQKRLSKDYTIFMVQETSTADVEEVKRGEWIDNNTKCSVCGGINPTTYIDDDDWVHKAFYLNYCPNCGAKMDGKDIKVPTTDGGKEE